MSIDDVNRRPVIGILSQEVAYKLECIYGKGKYHSYIAASYVKFLESSGARVVPISIGKDREYFEVLMNKINGVLLPGGATYFTQSNGYADAGEHIFKIARELNDKGDYFPLWGTCLGFELMPYLWLNRPEKEIRGDCESLNQVSRLHFVDDFRQSTMFGSAQDDVITSLSESEVTFNFHRFCFTQEIFQNHGIGEEWKILSTSDDGSNTTYISSMESTKYPFFGVQFHPEKPLFEVSRGRNIPHSREAVIANRYFADFFVEKCRESAHRYPDQREEDSEVIFNYPVTYTGLQGSTYEQCYLFEHEQTKE